MKMRQQRFPVIGDRRHRAADVCVLEGGILGLGQAADSAADEFAAPLERPVCGLFLGRELCPLEIGQIPGGRGQPDVDSPLGVTVNIDHDKAVNEIIDGFDAESVPGDLVADRLDSAGYSLGLQMDSDGSVELTTAGTAFGNTTALTEKTIYANIVDARTQQSSIGVPTAGRWLLVSPDTYGLLLKSPEFIKASDLGDAVVQIGAVGKIAGYTVFEDSTLGENVEYVAGHPNWFAVIDEWAVPVHLQDLSGSGDFIGASAVQGRKVYAYKVTKGQTILVKKKAA